MIARLWWRLVRFGFRLLYNELAWSYDLVSWVVSFGEWRRWQLAALPYLPAGRLLEIAHGPGHMLQALAVRGDEVYGCDLSAAMVRRAARLAARRGFPARLARCRVQALPFANGAFDGVLSTFPTTYIVEGQTLEELARVLRPGGRLVVVPEGHLTGRGPAARAVALLFALTGQRLGAQGQSWEETVRTSTFWRHFSGAAEAAGLDLTLHVAHHRRSTSTIVVATRR